MSWIFLDMLKNIDAIHDRHIDVEQYEIDLALIKQLQGDFTACRQLHLVAIVLKIELQQRAIILDIVYDQNLGHGTLPIHLLQPSIVSRNPRRAQSLQCRNMKFINGITKAMDGRRPVIPLHAGLALELHDELDCFRQLCPYRRQEGGTMDTIVDDKPIDTRPDQIDQLLLG